VTKVGSTLLEVCGGRKKLNICVEFVFCAQCHVTCFGENFDNFREGYKRESIATRLVGTNSAFVQVPRKSSDNVIEVASRRTFRMHTEFWPAAQCWNTRTKRAVPTFAVSLFLETELLTVLLPHIYSYIHKVHIYVHIYILYINIYIKLRVGRSGVRNPMEEIYFFFFKTRTNRPWGLYSQLKWASGLFSGIQWQGRGVDHPTTSSAEVRAE